MSSVIMSQWAKFIKENGFKNELQLRKSAKVKNTVVTG